MNEDKLVAVVCHLPQTFWLIKSPWQGKHTDTHSFRTGPSAKQLTPSLLLFPQSLSCMLR